MASWRDQLNRLGGKSRFVVSRIFLHLIGAEATPLLGVLNQVAQAAISAEGDLMVMGEGLAEICQGLLRYDLYWQAAANEGDVFWEEGDAADAINQLFTDSAQRYRGVLEAVPSSELEDDLVVPVTSNLVVMLAIAYEGEVPALETNLADRVALKQGLITLATLHDSGRLRAIQVHFCPAHLGEELTTEQIMLNFPELVPL